MVASLWDGSASHLAHMIGNFPVCRAETKANVPQSFAYAMFEDRESIPKYMSWIQEVKVCCCVCTVR